MRLAVAFALVIASGAVLASDPDSLDRYKVAVEVSDLDSHYINTVVPA